MIETEKVQKPRLKLNSGADENARIDRLTFLEAQSQTSLNELKNTRLHSNDVKGNIESYLGSIEVPVGLAGPIKLNHDADHSEYIYAPVATSEGALVASMSRGAQAINLSGGFQAKVIRQRMSRAPMFCFQTMESADKFCRWIDNHFVEIKKETKKYSNYANLVLLEPQLYGRNVHLRFDFETGDASGQNMTTTCTWNACLWIEEQFNKVNDVKDHIINYVIEANGSSDKKVSKRATINTRGIRVVSECHLPEKVIRRVLKTTSKELVDLYLKANPMAVNDGMSGYNVNVANAVAAFFASTGQDLACIHESSVGIMQMELTDKGLYIAMTLPSLVIGTVGGGVGLKGPQEILKVMGCQGSGKVERLAQIIAGFSLGLELSTMSAITSGQFATSHERLGRNHPVDLLKEHELDTQFFKNKINLTGLESVRPIEEINIQNGIVSEVTSKVSKKLIGFFPFELTENNKKSNVILKLKPLDEEVLLGFEIIAGLVSKDLKEDYAKWKNKNAFINSHIKEIEAYKALHRSHPNLIPRYVGSVQEPERELFGIVKEFLNAEELTHFNSEEKPEIWRLDDKANVITQIADIHGEYAQFNGTFSNRPISLIEKEQLLPFYHQISTQAAMALRWFNKEEKFWFDNIVKDTPNWYQTFLNQPQTLIHNDFSPRNICIRKNGTPCFYDWELCQTSAPQRDFIEFMAFTLTEDFNPIEFEMLVKLHHSTFIEISGVNISLEDWKEGLLVSAYEFLIDRVSFYMIGNIINQYKFLERVYLSTKTLITYMEKEY